jgi:cytoskeletal protein CcmA (bactofilin family)
MALKNFMGMGDNGAAGGEAVTSIPAAPMTRTVAPATSIDAETELSGKIRCKETIRIDGQVKGEVHCDKTVIVGEGAKIEAAIQAESIVIAGEVKGNIAALRKITLNRTARMTGDLSTPGIVIEEGAKLEGQIVIGGDSPSARKKPAAERQAPAKRDSSAASQSAPTTGVTLPAN